MKLNVGDIVEIEGKTATICYTMEHNNTHYICVAFEETKVRFEIYKYKFDQKKLLVAKVNDKLELFEALKTFTNEGISEYGLPKELEEMYIKAGKKIDSE